jgi:cytochrome c oxidase cbb3-type subunit 3
MPRGSKGFPNLTRTRTGCTAATATLVKTITEGRMGMMPPMAAAVGTASDVENVANYVLSLSGSAHDAVKAELGKPKFAACAACHGADGKGNPALGAPNLTDKVWLYGGSLARWSRASTRAAATRCRRKELLARRQDPGAGRLRVELVERA